MIHQRGGAVLLLPPTLTVQLGYPNNRPGPVNVSRPRLTFLLEIF